MNKKEVLSEFNVELKKFQKEIGFSVSLEDLEKEFFIEDSVLMTGFVKSDLFNQVGFAIVESFRAWAMYFNGLLMPNPQNILMQTESKLFNSKEERGKIWEIVTECMKFSNLYSFSSISEDKNLKKEFIDSAYYSWTKIIKPFVCEVLGKIYHSWEEK